MDYCDDIENITHINRIYKPLQPEDIRPLDMIINVSYTNIDAWITEKSADYKVETMHLGRSLTLRIFCKQYASMIAILVHKLSKQKPFPSALIILTSSITTTSSDLDLNVRITIPGLYIKNSMYHKIMNYIKRLWPKEDSIWRTINGIQPEVKFDIETCYTKYIYHCSNEDDKEPYVFVELYKVDDDGDIDITFLNDEDISGYVGDYAEYIDDYMDDGDTENSCAWIFMHKYDSYDELDISKLIETTTLHNEHVDINFDDNIIGIMMKLIKLISTTRLSSEIYMKEIASSINNMVNKYNTLMTKNIERGKTLFEKAIRRVKSAYDADTIARIWDYGVKCKRCTILTIFEYAREDSPIQFEKIFEKYYLMPLSEIENYRDTVSLAKFIYRLLCLNIIMVSGNKNALYENVDGQLIKLNDINERIRSYIVDGIVKQRMQEYVAQLEKLTVGQKQMFSTSISGVSQMLQKLKSNTYVNQIIKAVLDEFSSNSIDQKYLDASPCFTSISNGMIEIYMNIPTYRYKKIEDLLSKTSLLTYNPGLDKKHIKVKDFMAILVRYYGAEIARFMSIVFASRLVDGNQNKKIIYLVGPPDTGKSTLTGAIMRALGDYGTPIANNLLETSMGKNSTPDGATPAMTQAASARLAVGQEVSGKTDSLKLKLITGGDSLSLRKLFAESSSVLMKALIIMGSNDYPTFTSLDSATRGRLIVLPMTTRFSKEAPRDIEEQKTQNHFPKIEGFSATLIQDYNDCMLWLMMHYYPEYAEYGLDNVPKVSEQLINEHIVGADVNMKFIREYLQKCEEKRYILKSDVYDFYKAKINRSITYKAFLNVMEEIHLLGRGTSITRDGNTLEIWRGINFRKPTDSDVDSDVDTEPSTRTPRTVRKAL